MRFLLLLWLLLVTVLTSCSTKSAPEYTAVATIIGHTETRVLHHPDWARNATIYQVNVRQHTRSGTFAALEKDLARLDSLGVDIVWLMPVNPIGVKNRQGTLGNCFSIKNYWEVNKELGTDEDFRKLVRTIHTRKLKVIIGWAAASTAADHDWLREHPEWYVRDTAGTAMTPQPGANDLALLDFQNPELRQAMKEVMKYWIKEYDIDGFRCEAAAAIPIDFWEDVRSSLDSIKPVFMVSDAELKSHHLKAFDMSPADGFYRLMQELSKGKHSLDTIEKYLALQDTSFPRSAYRMNYTTGYTENAFAGTGNEIFGPARRVYDVLTFTLPGMPAMYTGQEGGEAYTGDIPHRLKPFDKDTVTWNGYSLQNFYSQLMHTHRNNPALWNGENGGSFERINTSSDEVIYAFSRKKDNNEVIVLLNFSDKPYKIDFTEDLPSGDFRSIFGNQVLSIFSKGDMKLPPYGYQVFVK